MFVVPCWLIIGFSSAWTFIILGPTSPQASCLLGLILTQLPQLFLQHRIHLQIPGHDIMVGQIRYDSSQIKCSSCNLINIAVYSPCKWKMFHQFYVIMVQVEQVHQLRPIMFGRLWCLLSDVAISFQAALNLRQNRRGKLPSFLHCTSS